MFTDGGARGNPGKGGFGAVIAYHDRVQEIGGGKAHTTNNEMELRAVIETLKVVVSKKLPIVIYTDSAYVVNGATGWIFGWLKNGWKTKEKKDVLHKKMWQELLALVSQSEITWKKIPGHVDLIGNERADGIVNSFADGDTLDLYIGPKSEYSIDIDDVSYDEEKAKKRSQMRKRQRAKAFSYVSMVDGDVKIHQTWSECEGRVKGATNPRYKKTLDKTDEQKIISEFAK